MSETRDMPCADMHLLIQAELDGELDAADAAAVAAHVRSCASCAGIQAELATLSVRLRGATRHTASDTLRRRVMALRPASRRSWAGNAASFTAGMVVAAGVALGVVLPREESPGPLNELVTAHIRALQPGHLVDVPSSDQHTVKPWFDGRIDVAPPVQDFAAQGFPLVGGRLDYVEGRAVAVLVYGRAKHLIDVFVWPGDQPGREGEVQGYNVLAWTRDGLDFRAVSDLNPTELGQLARLLRGESP